MYCSSVSYGYVLEWGVGLFEGFEKIPSEVLPISIQLIKTLFTLATDGGYLPTTSKKFSTMSRKRQVQATSEFIEPQNRLPAPGADEERSNADPQLVIREEGVTPESESSESFQDNPNPKRRSRRGREEALLGELKAARDQLQGITDNKLQKVGKAREMVIFKKLARRCQVIGSIVSCTIVNQNTVVKMA